VVDDYSLYILKIFRIFLSKTYKEYKNKLKNQMNKEITALDEENIKNKIYTIRGAQVILDSDLAKLYEVKSIRLREQVKRNIERFPDDFMFQLTKEEAKSMVSHFAIPSRKHLGGAIPYAFTEQGIAIN